MWGKLIGWSNGMNNFLFGIAYIMIDGVQGNRNFLFGVAYVRIDGSAGE